MPAARHPNAAPILARVSTHTQPVLGLAGWENTLMDV